MLIVPLCAQTQDEAVLKAYETRVSGKIGTAISMLNNAIVSDSTNAMAYFEMARITSDETKAHYIDKALTYDPDNTMYRFYKANLYMLTAYKAMQTNNSDDAVENVAQCIEVLKGILELKPNCKESLLFLIEIYGNLPEEMGGNIEQAQNYVYKLITLDPLYGAQGESVLSSKQPGFSIVKYWQQYIDNHGENRDGLIHLGKANLLEGNIDEATLCFNKALAIDPSQNLLYLDIARAHLYSAMRAEKRRDKELKKLKKSINLYLETKENKPVIVQAWCYGWLGNAEKFIGNEQEAKQYYAKAQILMPDYPKFTALPKVDGPPNKIMYKYKSYFRPF